MWRPGAADWWMGVLFAIGSTCFAVASFITQWASVPRDGLGVTFFAGSIFFTSAAFLQLRTSVTRADKRASLIQFIGTLFFNVSTFEAMQRGFDARQINLRVWTPDVFGSICFLVSSVLAYVLVRRPSTAWRIAALNLLGSVFFGVSAAPRSSSRRRRSPSARRSRMPARPPARCASCRRTDVDPERGGTVTVHQRDEPSPKTTNGDSLIEGLEALAVAYGNRFLLEPAPDNALPEHGMRPVDAMRLIGEDLILDGSRCETWRRS